MQDRNNNNNDEIVFTIVVFVSPLPLQVYRAFFHIERRRIYSASQKKGNPYIKLIFLKTVMIYQKKFTLLQNSFYPLSFDTNYEMYWPCMTKHEQ